jgi:hypothetical protein
MKMQYLKWNPRSKGSELGPIGGCSAALARRNIAGRATWSARMQRWQGKPRQAVAAEQTGTIASNLRLLIDKETIGIR